MPSSLPRSSQLWVAALLGLAFLLAACAGGDGAGDPTDPAAWQPEALTIDPEAPLSPILINSNLGVGTNRLAIALVDPAGIPVTEAAASATVYRLDTDADDRVTAVQEVMRTTLAARTIVPSLDHVHADGAVHAHDSPATGVFVTEVSFTAAGWWGIEVLTAAEPVRIRVFVFDQTLEPAVGDPAPATIQDVLRDVDDISQIDTSVPPNPTFHDRTVAEAIAAGKPTVVAFTTPAFCQTRLCGPVLREAVTPMAAEFGDQISIVHIEPFDLEVLANGGELEPVPALAEWGLFSEPWVFVIDAEGRVAAKFEGIVAADELRTVLRRLLG